MGSSRPNDFTRHARLRGIEQCIPTKMFDLHAQLILHESYSLTTRQPVSCDDSGGVNLCLHELIGASQQFSSNDHDRSSAIADFLVLFLCKINKATTCRVFYGDERKYGGAVV